MSRSYFSLLAACAVVVLSVAVPRVYALCSLPATDGVSVKVQSSLQQTVASASVGYTATIQNIGSASYDGAALAIEVRNASTSAVVDRFVQVDVSVAAGASASPTFIWHTSGALTPGTYMVNVVFVPQGVGYGDAFSDTRLPHTSSNITIVTGAKSMSSFSTSMNSSAPGTVSIPVSNNGATPYRGTVTWRVWAADAGVSGTPVVEKSDAVEMLPHGTAHADYVIPHGEDGSYYIEAKLLVNGSTQSITGAWVIKDVVSATKTSCDTNMLGGTGILGQIGILILIIALLVLGWGYWHKHRASADVKTLIKT